MHPVISERLWIANAIEARNLRLLCDLEIQAVVDVAINEPPAQLTREMIYFRIPILDGAENSADLVHTAIACVLLLLQRRFRTVVACSAGMSRSPAIAAAAMALTCKSPLEDCLLQVVQNIPHDVSPALWQSVHAAYEELRQTTR